MAQIEQSSGGKQKKGAQKKMQIHVDFTPMVDMNMLLITFFMLCTTMIKAQKLSIALPAPPDPDKEMTEENQGDTAANSRSLTIFIDVARNVDGSIKLDDHNRPETVLYYYEGQANVVKNAAGQLDKIMGLKTVGNSEVETEISNPIKISNYSLGTEEGIRTILRAKNRQVVSKLDALKEKWKSGTLSDEEYDAQRSAIVRNELPGEDLAPAQVSIKATDESLWEDFVASLDEMNINGINQFRVAMFNDDDRLLLEDYKAQNGLK